jgi:hypothetical protein
VTLKAKAADVALRNARCDKGRCSRQGGVSLPNRNMTGVIAVDNELHNERMSQKQFIE